ncbi:beta-ketoacyl-[acyl-carrier-protein] synthase II [Spirochaetia bacterium]|nr:beta-ketoacyl-[acyl-carrier-protein] synthase II [Spirochaetia bacterium]
MAGGSRRRSAASRKPLYLSPPGLICCAGKDRESFFNAALRGDQGGITAAPGNPGAGAPTGEQPFPVGRIDDGFLNSVPDTVAYPGAGPDFPFPRLLRIADTALEQIRPEVEQALAAYGKRRIAVCVGSCDNGSEWSLAAHRIYRSRGSFPPGYELRFQGASGPAEYISRKFGLAGPSLGIATACASGATAIIRAAELIRAGVCDAAIAGGVDVVSETVLLGFASLEALSPGLCNPFSKNRQGINLGEGAAFFVLRGEPGEPGLELLGAGESADAYHMTAPDQSGRGAIRAMEEALSDAGLDPGDVGYVNLHGTGTPLNDSMEAAAMAAVFSDLPEQPPVSSTKSITGHTLGAAGALELALCWTALSPPTSPRPIPMHRWDGVYDEALPVLRFAPRGAAAYQRICMSNSFAFGGCNVSLIIGTGEASRGR